MTDAPTPASESLAVALRELERHVADGGWDQPIRLCALVRTADLLAREPALAASVPAPAHPAELSSLEQQDLPRHDGPVELLAQIEWPETVAGVAVVVERYVMHQREREEVRIAVAALRDGARWCVLRVRAHEDDSDVLVGAELVPELADAVSESLRG